jgi:hypothetical protein
MAISLPELDATVRSFYEGRGEQVRAQLHMNISNCERELLTEMFACSKKLRKLHSIRYFMIDIPSHLACETKPLTQYSSRKILMHGF